MALPRSTTWAWSRTSRSHRGWDDHIRVIDEVDLSYPIILGPDNRVMDGMHRIAKAMLEGRTTLPAVRLDPLPEPDHRNIEPGSL